MANPQSICASIQELGLRWKAAQGASAAALYRFAHSALAYQSANPKCKLADIGAACATAVGRQAPYSKSWASRAINAARAIGKEPTTPEEATRFSDIFHGVNSAARKQKSASASADADAALRGAIAFARLAVKRGMDADSVESAIVDALGAADSDADADSAAA